MSGSTARSAWAPPLESLKPVMTSSKMRRDPLLVAGLLERLEEARLCGDHAHVARDRLDYDRGEVHPCFANASSTAPTSLNGR